MIFFTTVGVLTVWLIVWFLTSLLFMEVTVDNPHDIFVIWTIVYLFISLLGGVTWLIL